MFAKFYQSRLVFALETIGLILLLLFLTTNPFLLAFRYWFLLGGAVYFSLFFHDSKCNWKTFGFQLVSLIPALKVLVQPTIITMLMIIVLFWLFPIEQIYPLKSPGVGLSPPYISILRYGFISVPLQEIIFRSFLITRAGLVITNRFWLKIYAVAIFTLIHIPFKTTVLTLGSLILGWIWVGNFIKYKNIYSVAFSHIAVGLTYLICMYLVK